MTTTFMHPNIMRTGKRLYPITDMPVPYEPMQQSNNNYRSHRHEERFSVPIFHNLHQEFNKLSLLGDAPKPVVQNNNKRYDVSLLGNPPLVDDLDLPLAMAEIPSTASVTSSVYAQCDASFQRCTLNALPATHCLLGKSRLPLSILLEPYPRNQGKNVHVPLIKSGSVNRCTKCRSFINPFIQFVDGGLKWQCNLCNYDKNDVPPSFDWDNLNQQTLDRTSRAELNYGCVDYVASSEFMTKQPQPPVYLFVIDTSLEAVQTGMIEVLAETLISCIDNIPNHEGRTRIGFMTVNHAIGFYRLNNKQPELIVMTEIDDVYLPRLPEDLVVNLKDAKKVVLDLLERLKSMYKMSAHTYSTTKNNNCLGPALKAAGLLLASTGGKIVCFQASLPNMGVGALTPSKQQTSYGEDLLLEPSNDFYRALSEECTKSHVCTDMFVFGCQNIDLATLNVLPRFSGGQTHYYPGFNSKNQGDREKLKLEIKKLVKEEIGLEAIIRTKCSPGLIGKSYHGNFSFKDPDILVLPNVPRDGSYCIDLSIEKDLQGDLAYVQTCMLFTTSRGERCIRVMTSCLPITRKITDVFYFADQFSSIRAMTHRAIDRAVTFKVRDGKEYLMKKTVEICSAYQRGVVGMSFSKSNQLTVCRSLSLLPAMALGLIKSETFNDSGAVPLNMVNQSGLLLRTLPTSLWSRYVYPNFYSLHNMPVQAGTFDESDRCIMPPRLNLSSGRLERHGCYLIENGQRCMIWIGSEAVPQLCKDLLNVSHVSDVRSGQVTSLPALKNPFSERVCRIVNNIRTDLRSSNYYPSLYVVKEDGDPMLRGWFMTHLLEDHQQLLPNKFHSLGLRKSINSSTSYFQWLHYIKEKM